MKEKYISPVVEFIEFDKPSIITASICWTDVACTNPIDGVFDAGSYSGYDGLVCFQD